MRIGIVVNTFWNIYNFRRGLIKHFQKQGHTVVAIAPYDGYEKELQHLACQTFHLNMQQKGNNPLQDLKLLKEMYQIYKQARLDVALHFTIKPNIYGAIVCKLIGIPCINNVSGLGTVFIRKNFTSFIAHLLYKIAFRFPAVVFFQNQDDKKVFLEKKLINPAKTDLLPGSGINLSDFTPSAVFERNQEFTFLMIARLIYDKGIVEYAEAGKILKKMGLRVRLQVLGKIEKEANLGISEQILSQWEQERIIEYLGTTHDVRPFIYQADCVVLPSYREGTPRTLLEAAALAKPLIATDVPGCREVVKHEYNGFLCRARDSASLAETMKRMAELDDETLKKLGENSRKLVEESFDEKIVISKYEQAIQKVVGNLK
ncbi:MAG: glycosyltransferase family 4 protein [Cytophagales bacterium]|nr:glycosyltransferase family 4 protein [Cytophagales bacterium]MDW8383813.1 glycosyltransferase family 4 protein [Flammeovirgaceae bacterium]